MGNLASPWKPGRSENNNMHGRIISLFITILTVIPLTGCLYYGSNRPMTSDLATGLARKPAVIEPNDYFAYTPLVTHPKVTRIEDRGSYIVQDLKFPTFKAYFYVPRQQGPAPGIIVLPISNGNYIADRMASFLASNGYPSLRFKTRKEILGGSGKEDPLSAFENNYRAYIKDILQGIDWMAIQPMVDPDRLGVVGISLGAITGAIVTGLEPRINASVLILGGGDIVGILMTSTDKSVRRVRENLQRNEGLSEEEMREILASRLYPFDPLYYADHSDPSRFLMINAMMDRVIKREYTQAQWEALGKPTMIVVPAGHYTAILFLPYAMQKTLEHFRTLLGK